MKTASGFLLLLVAGVFIISGCEGPTGPAGPPGSVDTLTMYLGNNANNCSHCHEAVVTGWSGTAHSAAYKTDSEDCGQCHSTGWDPDVNNGGFDDNPVEALGNVQCEACHGPMGPNPATHRPNLSANLSGESCGGCHTVEYAEWLGAAHADTGTTPEDLIAEWGRSTCWGCHLTEGILATWDAGDYAAPTFADGEAHAVTCGACHDAHNDHTATMLRAQSTIALPNPTGATITGWGKGQMCGNCHRDRRTPANITDHLNNGNAHFGPHESPQANMLAGIGSYEIPGYTYDDTGSQHDVSQFPDMCVDCHMVKEGSAPHYSGRGHTFEPSVAACAAACHPGATTFDVDGVQTEIQGLLDQLETLILANPELDSMGQIGDTTLSTLAERRAAWAWFFAHSDGSLGVHNATYARTILDNSIAYLNTDRARIGGLAAISSH